MKWHDVKQMDDAALKLKCVELRKEMMGLRFRKSSGEAEKTHHVRVARRTIARIKTLLTQRTKAV